MTFLGSLMPSYVHFISDLKDQYHANIKTIQVDPKNKMAGAHVMAGGQLNSEIYVMPPGFEDDPMAAQNIQCLL